MTQMTFRASWKNHVRQAWSIVLYASLPIIVPVYLHYEHGIEDLRFATLVASAFFGLVFVPHFLIHLRYTLLSTGVSVQFDDLDRTITIKSRDQVKVIHDHDIESVDMVLPRSLARDEISVYPWQVYGYATLNLLSGENVLITSLVLPEL
jgi:hypothetical protein